MQKGTSFYRDFCVVTTDDRGGSALRMCVIKEKRQKMGVCVTCSPSPHSLSLFNETLLVYKEYLFSKQHWGVCVGGGGTFSFSKRKLSRGDWCVYLILNLTWDNIHRHLLSGDCGSMAGMCAHRTETQWRSHVHKNTTAAVVCYIKHT